MIDDMMSQVFKLFLSTQSIFVTLIGYIFLAGSLNLIKYMSQQIADRGE